MDLDVWSYCMVAGLLPGSAASYGLHPPGPQESWAGRIAIARNVAVGAPAP